MKQLKMRNIHLKINKEFERIPFSFHILYHKSSSLMIKIMIGNNNSYNILFDDNLGNRLIKMKQREKKIGYKTLTAVGGRFLEKFLLSFRH